MKSGTQSQIGVRNKFCWATLALAVSASLQVSVAFGQDVHQSALKTYSIPAGDLNSVLGEFSTKSGIQFIYRTEIAEGKRSQGRPLGA